jgi:hypothetical protein
MSTETDRTPLQVALDDQYKARQQRDLARMQARDRLDRLQRIAERHENDGDGMCSWCPVGTSWPCLDYSDATGVQR